ncbi:cytoplasmic tRNA 2-thiolation protein 2 isoform X2 [Elephas maximus indicus]|uniref:cytoplasmic tRNA 2-thiolation protein 2 isoform X2 n=1 Tax=Elephas maximus indicus TaxID=99487 RepID=UPI0021167E37|nr:cytoplasmic tRNA 2-thiolation protein 2 isoform X2 [Elephas maximus indicus]
MCQVGEDYGEPVPEDTPPPPPRPGREQKYVKWCVKCKKGVPVLVIRAGDAFCRDCFKAYYVHKFRAVLGKNRLIFPGEKVLLAWSGGPSSSSMLRQVLEGLSRESAKQLRFVPGVVYVDEGAACGRSLEDRAETLAEVRSILHSTSLPWHDVALEEVFGLPQSVLRHFSQEPASGDGAYKEAVDGFIRQQQGLGTEGARDSPSPALSGEQPSWPSPHNSQSPARPPLAGETEALCRLFNSVQTLTTKEELLQTLRTHLILHVARTHGYSKVMMGDSCTRLAIKLLTNLALGRGAFLAWDTGFADERHGDVVVVRPMREHTLKEVAFYNRLFAIPTVFTPAIHTKAPEKASIHRLMEAFVLRLQAQFPSTVSTVYRTSEKLVKAPRAGQAASPSRPCCLLCLCTLDIDSAGLHPGLGVGTWALVMLWSGGSMDPGHILVSGGPCTWGWKADGLGSWSSSPVVPRPFLPSPFHVPVQSLLADSATAFGAQTATALSLRQAQAKEPTVPCCSPGLCGDQGCCRGVRPSEREELRARVIEELCYSCRVNMKDLPSVDPLPPYILTEAQLRSRRAQATQEIREFLIEDSEDEVETGQS